MTLDEDEAVSKVKKFCLCYSNTQELQLKDIHDYCYQMQCAMYCTDHKWCDFVVVTEAIHIQRIKFTEKFWSIVLSKLKTLFYWYSTTISLPQSNSQRAIQVVK